MASDATLDRLLAAHHSAVEEFVDRAQRIDPGAWTIPRGAGKWTPAQEVRHVILAYATFVRDLRGGDGMRLVGTRWKRFFWRAIGLTSVVHFRKIPGGAPAPRELRPTDENGSVTTLVTELRERVAEFEAAFADCWRNAPRKQVTHAYFGSLSLRQSMAMVEVHTRHHAAFLAQSAPPLTGVSGV